ncbi:osmotic avoidance abnormal protein 3-like [Prorops nasuta]|uniref:osmotic avoidance abnormal protein 3-like n=1 Tax=Prorops nasuta TaxID=863751 RepID=UPI0034CEC8EB
MSESVKVAVRCRPMSNREMQQGCRNVVSIDPLSKCCTLESSGGTGGKVYQFDAAFGSESSTESVYEDVGSVVVEAVLDGYNSTVFAYGQTGCGKSFTMRGFVEKTLEHLFEATSTASSETRYLAILSYLEIYNERLRDLLQDGESLLALKEDSTRGTYVAGGLKEMTVKNAAECAKLVEQGDRRRAAAATKMNAESSRSHAVLTLALEAIAINDDDKRGSAIRRGRLHLVDLAGSERQGRTGATGERLKEAASINLSLSALGNVISALAAGNGRHVPYRDSKLTRLLRDSLGGNARTLMIACISPSDVDAEETLSTLRYAARARCIKNKPIVNEDPKDALLRQYQVELQRLRKLLESSDQSTFFLDAGRPEDEGVDEKLRERQYEEEVTRLKQECEDSNLSAQKLREELEALRARYVLGLDVVDSEKNSGGPKETVKLDEVDEERAERRRRKREAAKQEVLRRLEKLTIGGEALGNEELRKRRERRRKRLEALAGALEAGSQESSVFQVYGQLRSTEDALKRMARRAKQLEAEAADLQASWDAERRDLLRRELLMSQLCDAMVPHLKPGCPFRDVSAVRSAATWCDELGRWRLPDVAPRIPLPPATLTVRDNTIFVRGLNSKPDLDNNNNSNNNDTMDDEKKQKNEDSDDPEPIFKVDGKNSDIVDTYFKRNRLNAILAHVREAKTFEPGSRISKSGGSEENLPLGNLQLNALNLQSSTPVLGSGEISNKILQRQSTCRLPIGGWLLEDNNSASKFATTLKKNPPRLLEALPSYPQNGTTGAKLPYRLTERNFPSSRISPDETITEYQRIRVGHARSPTC